MPDKRSPDRSRPAQWGILFVRHGIGWILVVAGIVLLIVSPGGFGVEGFGMSTGSGLSILALNYLYRLGVSGDEERRREEEARVYLAEHGHWPDQAAAASAQTPPPAPAPASADGPDHADEADAVDPRVPAPGHEPHEVHREAGTAHHPGHAGRRAGLGLDRSPHRRRR